MINEQFRGKRISVLGAGRSGVAAVRALARLGALVTLSDSKPICKLDSAVVIELSAMGIPLIGESSADMALPEGTENVIVSPGIPKRSEILYAAQQRNIPIWSEIELAFLLTEDPIIAVTGTNGKTTTTLLIAAILNRAGFDGVAAGNVSADEIKCTLVEAAVRESSPELQGSQKKRVIAAEISSFQLEWVQDFAPKVAVLTNITPDHLNRHASFEEYASAKSRIFDAQEQDDWAVVNYDDPVTREIGLSLNRQKRCWFTTASQPPDDGPCAWLPKDILTVRLTNGQSPVAIMHREDMPFTLPGIHSIQNVLAAAAAALAIGGDADSIADAVESFPRVAHRMELVREIEGVRYINNSMCTNVAAAVSSIMSLGSPAIVIAGGADKGLEFASLTDALHKKAKHLILIGSAAEKMETVFRAGSYTKISRSDSLEEAVQNAAHLAVSGDTVILAPACASFDMFDDFEDRGRAFRCAVQSLVTEC